MNATDLATNTSILLDVNGTAFNLTLYVGVWDIQVYTYGSPEVLNQLYILHAIPAVPVLTLGALAAYSGVGEQSGVIITFNVCVREVSALGQCVCRAPNPHGTVSLWTSAISRACSATATVQTAATIGRRL